MKIIVTVLISISSVLSHVAMAQSQLFTEAFESFSTSRLWEFEKIPIDWEMEGILQADLNDGLNYLLENNPALAETSLTTVINKDTSVWQAYYYRAAARKQSGKFGQAERDLRRAVKLQGNFYEGFVELAKILHLSGQTSESERTINKAIRLKRTHGAAYYLKGDISLSQGLVNKAMGNYKECLDADSLFHDARIKLALLDLALKKDENKALMHLNTVLSYDSLQQNALLFRGILNFERNKEQALKDMSNLVLVNPNNLIGLYYRGMIASELGDYERGFGDFQEFIKTTATNDNNFVGQQSWLDKKIDMQNVGAYTLTRIYGLSDEDASKIREAYCHIITGKYNKTHDAIDMIFNFKREPVAVYLKAVAFEHQGRHVEAFEHYNRALKLDDQIGDAYKKRGIYEQELKQWDKSVNDFTAVLKLYPDNFRVNWIRGVSYFHMNKFAEAVADFDIYLKHDSTNKEVRGARGMAHLEGGQPLMGYIDFAVSDNLQGLNYQHVERLVDSVLQRKDTAQALSALNIITAKAHYFSEGFVQKFKIHLARNEWKPVAENILIALRNMPPTLARSKRSYLLTVQALVLSRDKHRDDALKAFSEAIRADKKNDLAYVERGRLLLQMRKSAKAEDDFRKAQSLGNEQATALLESLGAH